ncbi:plexin-C1 [Discoglossus pictus]
MGFVWKKYTPEKSWTYQTTLLHMFLFLCLVKGSDCLCTGDSCKFSYTIDNIAVGKNHVLVATENCLYQLNHMLQVQAVTSPRKEDEKECTNTKPIYYNKLLLVYNDTVLSCWNEGQERCYERHINNLSKIEVSIKIAPCDQENSATGFIIDENNNNYLVVATLPCLSKCETDALKIVKGECSAISIHKKENKIFVRDAEKSVALKQNSTVLNFIDSFDWGDKMLFLYYPYHGKSASILILKRQKQDPEFDSQFNLICQGTEQKQVILSSFKFQKSVEYFWAVIFSYTKMTNTAHKTALCIYNITTIKKQKGCILDFHSDDKNGCENITLTPIHQTPTLSHGDLTAVYAVEVHERMVFFLGTGNGQLLKVPLDSGWKAGCPEILYEFKEGTPVFRKITADPVDSDYIYFASLNEIKRIKTSSCDRFKSCLECLSAADPYCGWCHSQKRCTLKGQCLSTATLGTWVDISEKSGKCLKVRSVPAGQRQINITAEINTMVVSTNSRCQVIDNEAGAVVCTSETITKQSSKSCSCPVSSNRLTEKVDLTFEVLVNNELIASETFQSERCNKLKRCLECISSGCLWCSKESTCVLPLDPCVNFQEKAACRNYDDKLSPAIPTSTPGYQIKITSVNPERISDLGKSKVTITGENLQSLSRVLLIGTSSCTPEEGNVLNIPNNTHAIISLPKSRKEVKRLCINDAAINCTSEKNIYYVSLPTCSQIFPATTWLSAGRRISIYGKNLDIVDNLNISNTRLPLICLGNRTQCQFSAPKCTEREEDLNIMLSVEERGDISCEKLQYKADPIFTDFTLFTDEDTSLELRIKKSHDKLNIQEDEIQILVHYSNKSYPCAVKNITQNIEGSTVYCKAKKDTMDKINEFKMKVEVTLGGFSKTLEKKRENRYMYILLVIPVIVIIIIIFVAACLVTRYKSNKMSKSLSKQLELLECDIRQEIRDGFAELQMDRIDCTVENLGTIPFYDYKHFAQKILFPEECNFNLSEDLFENIPSPFHRKSTLADDESIRVLRTLFENKSFVVPLIHTLEKQSNFSIKDRCMFASFLTIKFQNNLVYLTELLEVLIQDLMEQSSNKHPKLMLRRTESVVEKLLTNWMSTVLYGFLRESVGEPLYLLVDILNQRVHKGPVDVITSKALYTVNEDWLLWQMPEFSSVELEVNFPGKPENGSNENVGQIITVTVLDCDTIGQIKEKILQAFVSKHGYAYGLPLSDISIELHHGQQRTELQDVDTTSVIMENDITQLNTVKHYKIENGANINVVPKENCNTPDIEYSNRYCHLILPNSEETEHLQGVQKTGKQKFKVKELYLTKLLSTKVAIHSVVEKLFRSIWKLPTNKPPIPIKYFFDFLDAQAESKKVTDPDVLHIWKTNSLPLRFWVNILKNPQFVFSIKKTPHLDSCLSVIAQAFMDAFSLSDQLLGKSAPTNKLLYAKDIPQFKAEVKSYYNDIKSAPPVSTTELNEFLTLESKKHEHEFKEDVALLELYKYIDKYYYEILSTFEKEAKLEAALKEVKKIMENKKMCAWE